MKKFVSFLTVAMLLIASIAFAGGKSAPAVGGVNVPLTVPKVSKSACSTLAAGKTGTLTVDVSNTTMISWKAITSAVNSTAVVLKRFLNSNTAYMPSSGETNLPIERAATSVVYGKFSTADNSVTPTVCYELN